MRLFADYDIESLGLLFASWGFKPEHARNVLRAYYAGADPLSAPDLGKSLTAKARSELRVSQSTVTTHRRSVDGTEKILLAFENGGAVESVLMPGFRSGRAAGCVSSQIGCAMGCDFCASTRHGLERNLTGGEIIEQFLHLRRLAAHSGRRLKTLVFMGMGEPMHNLDAVLHAIRCIAHPRLGGLGYKHITVSTVGIIPGIERLARENLGVHLAVSLHAPDDATRTRIVPANRRYNVADILTACANFQLYCDRIPTIEYCMLAGVNDSDDQAHLLADLIGDRRFHVNLIPYNDSVGASGIIYMRPSEPRRRQFISILRARGIVAHFRHTRGHDVEAACGQLRETASA